MTLSFLRGLVAAVNPCGFVLLPTYLMFFLGADTPEAASGLGVRRASIRRALTVSSSLTAGFMTVFIVVGIVTYNFTSWIQQNARYATIVIAVGLVGLGIAMLSGRSVGLSLPRLDVGGRDRGVQSMFLFGVAYAVASLGCTIGLFLPTLIAVRNDGFVGAIGNVAAYGMSGNTAGALSPAGSGRLRVWHQDAKTTILNYDTSTESISRLLERAKNEGIQLIIGPLNRDIVTELASMELETPVLALNRTSDRSFNPKLYQFGLSPEDEINQVVEQTYGEGLTESIVVYPNSDWGKRNFAVFENSWGLKGGNIVDSAAFSNQRDYSRLIKSLLNIDKSEERGKELRRITGHSFEFTPRRRKDIDFILLLANASQARGINPTLEHFYAEDIPVYSTSHIYEVDASWIDTVDLDGITFCDIPWKLTQADKVQQEIQGTWSGAKSGLAPFYAMGLDA